MQTYDRRGDGSLRKPREAPLTPPSLRDLPE